MKEEEKYYRERSLVTLNLLSVFQKSFSVRN